MSRRLFKSALVFASWTFISRILGLVREMAFAATFGASAGMDAFLVAFRIPNFFRRLFAEGAFVQAFVPVLSEQTQVSSLAAQREFIQKISGTLFVIVAIITAIGMCASGLVIAVFAPGFWHEADKYQLASSMLRITFPYLLLITLTAFAGAILNTHKRFSIPAFTPVLLNVCLIIAAWFVARYYHTSIEVLAWAVLIAGIIQLGFQLPFIWRLNLLVWPKWGWRDARVKKVIKLMLPAIVGASVAQISLLVDTAFASFLPTGSVSWLYYSDRLMQFPLGVFGVALATVVLPHLSDYHVQNNREQFEKTLDWAHRLILLIALPSSLGLLVLAGPIIITIFAHGAFTAFDAAMAERSLIAFAVGIPFFIWVKVLVSAFYAQKNTKTPVKIAMIALSVNFILNCILIFPLAHAGLALSTSIASAVNGILLLIMIRRQSFKFKITQGLRLVLAVSLGLIVMGCVLYYFHGANRQWLILSNIQRLIHLIKLVVMGGAAYVVCLLACGIRARHFLS